MPGNLQDIPLSVIESWQKPNYVDPVRRSWMPAYSGVLQGIATLMVFLRLWLRCGNRAGALGLDDALLIPAFLAATMFTAIAMLSTIRYGEDRHIWDVPPTVIETTALMAWLSELAFLISTSCTKISVLLFYRRLVEGTFSKRWKWATIAAIVFTACYCIAFVLTLVFNCRPTEAYWKAFSPTYTRDYHCTDTKILNPLSGVLSVVSDFYSVVLPMGMLRHFQTDRRKKIALNVIFSLGLLVVAAGAIRTYYLDELGHHYDVTWVGFNVLIWAELEVQLAIICASAPALRVLFRQYLKDPISRVMHTASAVTHSGAHSSNRDSRQRGTTGSITYSLDSGRAGDKGLIEHSVKPALGTVGEQELDSPASTTASEPYTIKTPADFESYALRNLERHRSQANMKPRLSEPFTTCDTPRSWLDTDDKA